MTLRFDPMEIPRAELLDHLAARGIVPQGTPAERYDWVEPLDRAGRNDIGFCRFEGEAGLAAIRASGAGALFVPRSLAAALPDGATFYMPCEHPRLEVLQLLRRFWREREWTFDPAANPCVHPEARIAEGVRIGPFTVIGPGVEIGAGTRIGSGCHIERARIGRSCIIAHNVSIGRYGFGYEDDPATGEVLQFPHIGAVDIADRVEIGSSTCVDRGSIGDTVIGEDCKIDNLIHIAHNVRLGKRCKVIALAIVGGSVVVGDDSWIAPAAAIRDWRRIGRNALVGMGAVVTKDVGDGEVVAGNPARPISRTTHRYK